MFIITDGLQVCGKTSKNERLFYKMYSFPFENIFFCMTYAYAMYMTNFNYMQMKMCTEDCALSVHHSICIMTIR